MGQTLSGAAGALRELGAALSGAAAGTHLVDPGVTAFGGRGPGQLGQLGDALHARFHAALEARAREAAAHGVRTTDLADVLARAAAGYADVDHSASQRKPEVAL